MIKKADINQVWHSVLGGGALILAGLRLRRARSNTPNEIIHQSVRLRIMSALNAVPPRTLLEFVRLKAVTGATDGNLGAHLNTLEKAGYVKIVKNFVGKKPRTRVGITMAGKRAFQNHVIYLREILDSDIDNPT